VTTATIGTTALFIGGYDRVGGTSDAVDAYDSATGDWWRERLADPMGENQAQSAPLLSTGVALMVDSDRFGLYYQGGPATQVHFFDAATRRWDVAPLSRPRLGATLGAVGTKALVIGGRAVETEAPLDLVDVYDRASGAAWTAQLSGPRRYPLVASAGSRLVVMDRFGAPTADLYDADAGTWTTAPVPTPLVVVGGDSAVGTGYGGARAAVVGQRLLFGSTAVGSGTTDADRARVANVYDTEADRWSVGSLSGPYPRQPIVVGSTVLYVVVRDGSVTASPTVDVYDDRARQWTATTAPQPLSMGVAVTVIGGRWAVFSSSRPDGPVVFDAETLAWSSGGLPPSMLDAYPATADTFGRQQPSLDDPTIIGVIDPATYARRMVSVAPARKKAAVVQIGRQIVVAGGGIARRDDGSSAHDVDIFWLPD
jgi:hypothetical protein